MANAGSPCTRGRGSAPFDGEGLPTRRTVIVEKGVLERFFRQRGTVFVDLWRRGGANAREAGYGWAHGRFASSMLLSGLCKIRAGNIQIFRCNRVAICTATKRTRQNGSFAVQPR